MLEYILLTMDLQDLPTVRDLVLSQELAECPVVVAQRSYRHEVVAVAGLSSSDTTDPYDATCVPISYSVRPSPDVKHANARSVSKTRLP